MEFPARGITLVNRNLSRGALILALVMLASQVRLYAQKSYKSFLERTPADLAKQVPELKHLAPATNESLLPSILEGVGKAVADFYDNLPNTTCTERFISAVDTPGETRALYYDTTFNYVALVKPGEDKTRLEEFRTGPKGEKIQLDSQATVITIGFVSMTAHFHPAYQADSRFRYLGRSAMEGRNSYVVVFAQRPEVARRTTLAVFKDRTATSYVQGLAWIDPESFRILRLRTDIQQPDDTVGLFRETTEIEYFEAAFRHEGKTLWLPRQVNVSGQLNNLTFRNRHHYSDYRLFVVETNDSGSPPS